MSFAVNWTQGEKRRFKGLGVDLFGRAGDEDDHARQRFEHEGDPACTWCGERLEDCLKGRGTSCGFAIEP
jgi:hypothetical protein